MTEIHFESGVSPRKSAPTRADQILRIAPLPDTQTLLSQTIADQIAQVIREKPDCCLGLPTGRTPKQCYEILKGMQLDWSRVSCFQLDEYLNVPLEQTFWHYMQTHLYEHVNVSWQRLYNPVKVDDYDGQIAASGGLDMVFLGLGRNGHIAFNEPGTPLESWTHTGWLDESTRQSNREFFGSLEAVPQTAVTMGIRTILGAKKVILLASGASKRDILSKAMREPMTAQVPASFLNIHNNLQVLADFDW